MKTKVDKTWLVDCTIMMIFLSLLYLTLLGHRPLFVPDEGRYAEIAREMAENNDFITPYLNHIKYFEKPPFFYWMSALAIKGMGVTISAVRIVNAIFSILGCLATYLTARYIYNRLTGLLSSALLATSGLYFVMGHTVSLDLPVTVFITMTLYGTMLAICEESKKNTIRYLCIAASFAALSILTKGLIGLILPCLIILFFILITRRFELLRLFFSWKVIGIFLLIALPWHIAVTIKNPEFPYFYIIEQHFLRYSKIGIGHYQPIWFFIPWLILGFFPWIVFLINALIFHIKNTTRHQETLFLFIWIVTIFVFFSFSKSKLIPYILPLFPALAILVGHYLANNIQNKSTSFANYPLYLLTLFQIAISAATFLYLKHTTLPDTLYASISLGIGSAILWLSLVIAWYQKKHDSLHMIIALILGSASFWLSIIIATPALDTRSILPFAQLIKARLMPDDEIISYDRYYQDLPFYLKKRITIVNWQNELRFGMKHQTPTPSWMISRKTFIEKITHPNHRLYILMNKEDFNPLKTMLREKNVKVLKETIRDVLLIKEEEKYIYEIITQPISRNIK